MNELQLAQAIEALVGPELAREIARDFIKLRHDVATGTLERPSAGKFVESFVQCLQQLSEGKYKPAPNVENYLNNQLESKNTLPDGLRLCGGRVARSIYTMRSKRGIIHKNGIDPNSIDLAFTYHGAVWIMAELIRCASKDEATMEETANLIDLVSEPVGPLVETIDDLCLVHAEIPARAEVAVLLLHRRNTAPVTFAELQKWTKRKEGSLRSELSRMRSARLIVGDSKKGFKLTSAGFRLATEELRKLESERRTSS